MPKKNYLTKRTRLRGEVIKDCGVHRGYCTLPGLSSESGRDECKGNAVQPDEGFKMRATGKATDYETELGKSDLENLSPTECNKKGI